MTRHAGNSSQQSLPALLVLVGAGIVVSAIYALAVSGEFLSVLSTTLMTAGACLVVGGLLGFLFGIPKVLTAQRESVMVVPSTDGRASPGAGSASDAVRASPYEPNTNLEQVSDWLTKILVGVGLTQISSIQERLASAASYLAPALGDTPSSKPFAIFLILYFLICGFFISYLWTRLYFGSALQAADRQQLQSLSQKVEELDVRTQLDSAALLLVNRVLSSEHDGEPVDSKKLVKAIKDASPDMRAHIFYLAAAARSSNWGPGGDREKMARTIPIYRALIEADLDGRFHRNHGELGYALKDKLPPDWKGAFEELNKAIEIRTSRQEPGYVFYEGNRAICHIHIAAETRQVEPASSQEREAVLRDLRVGHVSEWRQPTVLTDPVVMKWMIANASSELREWLAHEVPDGFPQWIESDAPPEVRAWVSSNGPEDLQRLISADGSAQTRVRDGV